MTKTAAAAPRPTKVMSLAAIDETALSAIAKACKVLESKIEDVYSCTPLQSSMIAATRNEMFHFVLSAARPVDPDPFCDALRQVVAHNAILRTRLVECAGLGTVNVVTNEEHVTNRQTGYDDIEKYLRHDDDAPHHRFGPGELLFRSAYVGQSFVATIHHAVMDYWSIDKLLKVDTPVVYAGQSPIQRPAFKTFVAHCLEIDEEAARAFWAPRFKGSPTIFPTARSIESPRPCVTEKKVRSIILKRMGGRGGITSSHVPFFIEAAWALTAATYADSDTVAYGYVLSGRSATLDGIENTLGPTVAEVPVQVNLRRQNMTVDKLIKERAASLRQLQQHSAVLQFGLDNIGALSESAKTAAGFQTLVNIRPAVFTDTAFGTTTDDDNIKLRMVWLRGYYPLQLIFSIMEDGVTVWARTDSAVVSDDQLDRILNQFEHTLRLLTEVPPQTRLADLPLLDPHARSDIFRWNKAIPLAVDKCLHDIFRDRVRSKDIAVEAADGSATYASLHRMSGRLAEELRRRGVSRGKRIGYMFERSLWAIVAVLGILKSGGTCVPIDRHDAALLSSLGVELVVTSSAEYAHAVGFAPNVFVVDVESMVIMLNAPETRHSHSVDMIVATSMATDLAYILSSGGSSIATRKYVMLEHGSLASALISHTQRLDWRPGCRMVQFSPYTSSHSVLEIFGTLLSGGCLCVPSSDEPNLPSFITTAQANWAILPPSILRNMSPSDVPSLHSLLSLGGEHVGDDEACKNWVGALRFYRGWGACEASMLNSIIELVPTSPYFESIGKPVGCGVWIVKPENIDDLAPLGGVGEVLIEGPGVARGYANATHAATAASFVSPPTWASSHDANQTESRFFRTGALAKYNADGSISWIGLVSKRIKLGGQTVQLEQVESVLAHCGHVRDVVTTVKISAGRTQLVAVVCLADPRLPRSTILQKLPDHVADPSRRVVAAWAQSRLPADRVPTIYHMVEELPRSPSYEVDYLAVQAWVKTLPSS